MPKDAPPNFVLRHWLPSCGQDNGDTFNCITLRYVLQERQGTYNLVVASDELSSPSMRYTLPFITYSKLSARDGPVVPSATIRDEQSVTRVNGSHNKFSHAVEDW